MKLNKLYSNYDSIFEPINFNQELNIILAEVRNPTNKKKSSHCLGKTLLGSLIDYCLLKKVDKRFFLNKNYNIFKDFSFYLEIMLGESDYLTIKRSVKSRSEICIIEHDIPNKNLDDLNDKFWDFRGGLDKAKEYLNSKLNFSVLPNDSYRKSLSYFLRANSDFGDVFRLNKYQRSPDIEWKPLVASLLGIKPDALIKKYELDAELKRLKREKEKMIDDDYEISKQEERLKTIISLKESDLFSKEEEYNSFNFKKADIETPKELALEIDEKLSNLVSENYYLNNYINQAKESIVDYNIDLSEIEYLYNEIGLYFEKQLKKEYESVVDFNREILEERNGILRELIEENQVKLDNNVKAIEELNEKKSKMLSYVKTTKTFDKFKILQEDIIDLRTRIDVLKLQLESLDEAKDIEKDINSISRELVGIINNIKKQLIEEDNNILESIKKNFTSIIVDTLGDVGVISTPLNKMNNIEFVPEIIDISTNKISSKDAGTTYKKLMCAALDLALAITYSEENYFHFIYHDGVFDGLDDRQKENFFEVVQEISKKYNIQYIFTTIQDELPPSLQQNSKLEKLKENKIIIKVLHDGGNEGRLFKMNAF
ncbi:hypothetical protein COM77_04920 [Bacillus cereus]|uniref:DUF2326 domain-containing protein n=3 Tax=Bacillus cereus TaxID=1396 RepID=UPI000BED374C|nr:DUF2326 domain-containing protein [Bacillus cereus]PEB38176.1 hypothetical protein COM77_04920 [Bacillus cereus]